MRSFLLTLFTVIFIVALFTSCGSNYYLKRSRKNMLHALQLGAKVDSLKTVIHDTITVTSINDSVRTVAKIDTVTLKELCPEVTTEIKKKALQKAVCPNDSIDQHFNIDVTMGGHKYEIPVSLKAWSIGGKAGYNFNVEKTNFEYVKTEIQVEAKPNDHGLKWWQLALSAIGILIVGIVIGRVLK